MADDPAGSMRPDGPPPPIKTDQVPEAIRRRYVLDRRGGRGVGFFADANIPIAAFRDEGRRLVATRADPNAIRDMAAIAEHRQWSIVVVRGDETFRREAWIALRRLGVEVQGYKPTERDVQTLRRDRAAKAAPGTSQAAPKSEKPRRAGPALSPEGRANLQVIEAVVRERVRSTATATRIITAARERMASWLEQGGHIRPLQTRPQPRPIVEDPKRRPERTRSR